MNAGWIWGTPKVKPAKREEIKINLSIKIKNTLNVTKTFLPFTEHRWHNNHYNNVPAAAGSTWNTNKPTPCVKIWKDWLDFLVCCFANTCKTISCDFIWLPFACPYLAASPEAWPPGRPGWRWPSCRLWLGWGPYRPGQQLSDPPSSPDGDGGTHIQDGKKIIQVMLSTVDIFHFLLTPRKQQVAMAAVNIATSKG